MKEAEENIMDAEATDPMAEKNVSDKQDDGDEENSEKNVPNTSTSAKKFDDFCFKTPLLPHKRSSGLSSSKKRQSHSKLNGESVDDDKDSPISSSLCRLSIEGGDRKDDSALLDVFVSIGKDSYLCPRSRQYFAAEFPGLPQKRPANEEEDLLKEVIVDEFSLLLFSSVDDFDVLKMHEIEVKEREDATEKRKTCEQNIRPGKIKKKGPKSKMDYEREEKRKKREQKKREKLERREKRRIHKEQKEQLLRERQERRDRLQTLSAEERLAEKRVYKKKKRETLAENTAGPSASTSEMREFVAGVAFVSKPKEKLSEEERQLKRERKRQERLLKSQFKEAFVGESSSSVATLISHASIIGKLEPRLEAISASTSSAHPLSLNAIPIDEKRSTDVNQKGVGDAYSSSTMAATTGINGLLNGPVQSSSSGDKAGGVATPLTDVHWSALIQSRESHGSSPSSRSISGFHHPSDSSLAAGACSAIASTSATISNTSSEINSQAGNAVKRPASAIGIAQRNGIIFSPPMELDGRNGIISQSSDLPPLNKLRKLDMDGSDFLKNHNQLSSGISNTRMSSSNTSNFLAKSEVKLENGFAHNNKASSSTANSQHSTPHSKGAAATPLSTDGAHGNSASSSSASVVPFSSPPSSAMTAGGIPPHAKLLPPLGGGIAAAAAADPAMAAIIQQLLGGAIQSNAAVSSTEDPSSAIAANLLHQSLFMNHPELLMNLHHQQQRQQQLKNQLPTANPLDSPSNLMAAAAAINSGFPLIGMQQQFLQQPQQLDNSQKQQQQTRLIGSLSAQQQQALGTAALPISNSASTSLLAAGGGGFPPTAPLPFLLHSGADPLLNGTNLSLASQLAEVAMLGKAQKAEKWSDRHVSIANQIARHAETLKNLPPSGLTISQQQQIAAADLKSQQQLQQQLQQRFIQQQLQQQNLLSHGKFDVMSFLPGNSRQNPSEAASMTAATSFASSRKNSEIANNHYQQQLAQQQGSSQQQQKRVNVGPTTTTTMGLTKQQQEQHKQQLIQMANLKQQQQAAQQQSYAQTAAHQQQQQLQMEALKRFQQHTKTAQQQQQHQQQQNLMAQFQQQQIQLQQQQQSQHKSTPTPSSNSTRPPTAKTHQQLAQSTQIASLNGVGPAAAASQVLSPSSFINSSLFYPGAAPKLPPISNHSSSLLVNTVESVSFENRQAHQQKPALPSHLPPHSNAINLPLQSAAATPHNFAPTVSAAEALSAIGLTQHLAYQNHLQQQQNQQKQQYTRVSNTVSQQQFGALGFPITSHASLLGGAASILPHMTGGSENGGVNTGSSGRGSLTSGTSAQANAAAAAAAALGGENSGATSTTHNQINLMALQQQIAAAAAQPGGNLAQGTAQQSNSINNPMLAQMAMAQLMMQQLGTSNSATNINNFNPLLPLQGQQQQMAANNFLASLGILSNPGTPSSTAQQMPDTANTTPLLPQFATLQQHTQQRAPPPNNRFANSSTTNSTPSNSQQPSLSAALTTTPAATVPATTSSTSATSLQQQQQDLLIQAALLHSIQSLETKHHLPSNNHDNSNTMVALASAMEARTRPPTQIVDGLCQQRQIFLADQLQHQQALLERMGVASGNTQGLC